MKDFINELTYSTVKIECINCDGYIVTGSGFVYTISDIDKKDYYFVITNKHVIGRANTIKITIPKNNPINNMHFETYLNISRIIFHPDSNVDLCAITVDRNLIEDEEINCFPLWNELLPKKEDMKFSVLEQVLMLGYPDGLWDSVNCKPIIRYRVTATHIELDYEGRKEFLIDVACFPGSSGSPVFILDKGKFIGEEGERRLYLVGVLYAGPQHLVTGEIAGCSIYDSRATISSIPNNLGCVISSVRIRELEEEIIYRMNIVT